MKNIRTTALALALAVVPAAALAQTPPPSAPAGQPGPGGPMSPGGPMMMRHQVTPQERQQFEAMRTQMMAMHRRTKAEIIGALTPSHRTLLGTIAAGLALGSIPDTRTGAQQLDAALSSGEKTHIFAIVDASRTQERAAMEAARMKAMAQLPPEQQQRMQQMHAQMQARMQQNGGPMKRPARARDAGMDVLRVALGGGMRGPHDWHRDGMGPGHMGPGGPMRPRPMGAPGMSRPDGGPGMTSPNGAPSPAQ